uniref:FAD-dependent oxidoreductase n=1 Tax=Streptomyces xiaopingdaonensis TaxID=1565415 RepID=UPI0003645A17
LDPAALRREFPQFAGVGRRDVGVWDPEAGLCYPERAVCASVAEARRLGAEVRTRTEVLAVEPDAGGVTLHTSAGEVRAGKAVLATGAGLPALVPELPLVPRPTPLTWFRAADPASDAFTLPRFPAFVWERPDGDHLWGHGSDAQGGHDVKVGVAGLVDDTPFPWQPDDGRLDAAARRLAPRIATAFPGLVPHPVRTDPCVVTDSPDGQFLLGPLPHAPNLLVAGGDTGHGFKRAAGVGELLAQYVHGEEPYCDAGFTDPARFTG